MSQADTNKITKFKMTDQNKLGSGAPPKNSEGGTSANEGEGWGKKQVSGAKGVLSADPRNRVPPVNVPGQISERVAPRTSAVTTTDLNQAEEEEEIVAQVSSLISNMDLSQQNKLMSQLLMENQVAGSYKTIQQPGVNLVGSGREPPVPVQSQMSFGAIVGQGESGNQSAEQIRSTSNFHTHAHNQALFMAAQNNANLDSTDALLSQLQNQGLDAGLTNNFMSSLVDGDEQQIGGPTQKVNQINSIDATGVQQAISISNQQYMAQQLQADNQSKMDRHQQMQQGFDVLRLSHPPIDALNEDFLCGICHKIVNLPLECQNSDCSQLFCQFCCKRDDNQCPRCTNGLMRAPSKIIIKIYSKYEISCGICCKSFGIQEVLKHEVNCKRRKCNNELCGVELKGPGVGQGHMAQASGAGTQEQQNIVKFYINGNEMLACSKKCKKVAKFAYMLKKNNENEILKTFESMLRKKMQKNIEQATLQNRGMVTKSIVGLYGNKGDHNVPTIYSSISGDATRQQYFTKSKTVRQSHLNNKKQELRAGAGDNEEEKVSHLGQLMQENQQAFHNTIEDQIQYMFPETNGEFAWDPEISSKEIVFSADFRHAFLHETNYYFRTITANRPFFSGIHYWEIIADARTEHELKIGVTAQQTFNVNSSFSDYEFGFAYYGLGQLRHANNSLGEPYGKFFKKKGVLGVLLNMNIGTLSFALDGEFMGVAFEDKLLTKGPIWAAVSLLHIGGLTLISGSEPPPYIPINEHLKKQPHKQSSTQRS